MASFEEILNKPASEIKPPEAYPVGTYHCLVDGPPSVEESSQKKTPGRGYKFKILSPMQDVDQQKYMELQLQNKQVNHTFWITEDSAWRYKQFLTDHLGIEEANGSGQSKSLKEMEAEAPGKQVLVKLAHQITQDGTRAFHRVDSTAHV